MIIMTQMQISMKNGTKKETDGINSVQHLLKIKIKNPIPTVVILIWISQQLCPLLMSPCLSYAVCSLKLLGSLGKTEASLRSFNLSLFYHQFLSFSQGWNWSALSLSWGQEIHQIYPISLCNKWTSPRFGRVRC